MIKEFLGRFRTEYGFTGQDLIIAMFILVLFLGLMTAVYSNLSNTYYEIKLTADATELGTNILEYYDGQYYDDIVIGDNLICPIDYDKNKYSVKINSSGDGDNKKNISVTVSFSWKDEVHNIDNSMVKEKENIKPNNSPDLDNYVLTPVKLVIDNTANLSGHFEKTTKDDTEWYNYENQKMAVAVEGGVFDNNVLTDYDYYYVWVPSFFIYTYRDSNDDEQDGIIYYYKDTNKLIRKESNGSYVLIGDNSLSYTTGGGPYYKNDDNFFKNKTGMWLRVNYENNKLDYYSNDDDDEGGEKHEMLVKFRELCGFLNTGFEYLPK